MSDIESWGVRAAVGATVAALAGLFLRVRTNESRLAVAEQTLKRAEACESDVNDMKIVHARILERLEHLPTHADLQLLHNRISKNGDTANATARDMAVTAEALTGLRKSVDRLHELELARETK